MSKKFLKFGVSRAACVVLVETVMRRFCGGFRLGVSTTVLVAVTGCMAGAPDAPEFASRVHPGVGDIGIRTPGSARLDVTSSNVNVCDAGPAVRDENGKFLYWNSRRQGINVDYAMKDTQVVGYRVMRFNAKGLQTDDIECVLKQGEAAKSFVTSLTSLTAAGASIAALFSTTNIQDGTWCWILNGGQSLDCNGTACYRNSFMRAGLSSSSAAAPSGWDRFSGPMAFASGATYFCDDADYLVDQGEYFQILHPGDAGYGGCEGDNTYVPGIRRSSLCESNEIWIDHEGEDGEDPDGSTTYAGPDIGPNAQNFWAPKNYTKGTNFIIDCRDQYGDNHYFTATTASFTRIGNKAEDKGAYGYRAKYNLVGFGTINPTTDARDNFIHGNVIPINSTLYSIGSGNYSGGFTQGDKAACKWYGPHRRH